METELGRLTKTQRDLVKHQLDHQRHRSFVRDFPLSVDGGEVLSNFIVEAGVLNPFITASRFCAWYLAMNNGLYSGKVAFDIGSGTGLLGITMAVNGAARVVLSDISELAFNNTSKNVSQYCSENSEVILSNLFEKINGPADCIVFNHPFFADDPPEDNPIAAAMVADRSLIRKFFLEARSLRLNPGGTIVMPFFEPAGKINDPKYNASDFGFTAKCRYSTEAVTGMQLGRISIYEISRF